MASASTQTSPGVLNLPSQRRPYSLRSAQSSTPGGKAPPVVDLSPDMFRDGSP